LEAHAAHQADGSPAELADDLQRFRAVRLHLRRLGAASR
jgi:hypothetical protein